MFPYTSLSLDCVCKGWLCLLSFSWSRFLGGFKLALEIVAVGALVRLFKGAKDAAVSALTPFALVGKFLKVRTQVLQGGYLLVQIFYVFVDEGVDPLAVLRGLFAEGQKLTNLGEIDAVQSAVADKAQLVQILACVDAVVAFAALRRFEQALLFVVPDRNDLAAGLLCEFTYLHGNAGANIPVFLETGKRFLLFRKFQSGRCRRILQ